jgi:hypothetical protein
VLFACPALAWFAEGHEIVAIIAADDLTPTARSHVAQILGVSGDTRSVETAMAATSIRPDTEFRRDDTSTAPWHLHRLPIGLGRPNLRRVRPKSHPVIIAVEVAFDPKRLRG